MQSSILILLIGGFFGLFVYLFIRYKSSQNKSSHHSSSSHDTLRAPLQRDKLLQKYCDLDDTSGCNALAKEFEWFINADESNDLVIRYNYGSLVHFYDPSTAMAFDVDVVDQIKRRLSSDPMIKPRDIIFAWQFSRRIFQCSVQQSSSKSIIFFRDYTSYFMAPSINAIKYEKEMNPNGEWEARYVQHLKECDVLCYIYKQLSSGENMSNRIVGPLMQCGYDKEFFFQPKCR